MPDPRFEFLVQPLHELHEHLKAELARNPFPAPARPDPGSEDRRQGSDEGPSNPSWEDPDEHV